MFKKNVKLLGGKIHHKQTKKKKKIGSSKFCSKLIPLSYKELLQINNKKITL